MVAVAKVATLVCIGLLIPTVSPYAQTRALSCAVEVAASDSGSGRIGAVAVGPGRLLAWTDGRPGQFMIRDKRGRVRAGGRLGDGPGEFRSFSALDWWGDTLWISDASLPRVQFFNDSGGYLYGVTAATRASWAPRKGGQLVGIAPRRLSADLPYAVLRSDDRQRLDTIAHWPLAPAPRFMLPGGGRMGNPQPFAPETVIGASPDHSTFCAARPTAAAWQIECVGDNAVQRLRTTVSLQGRKLTDALFDSVITVFSRGRDRSEVRRLVSRPSTLPAINAIRIANTGDLWLQRTHVLERANVWQHVSRDGKLGPEISVAPLSRVLRFTSDSVWGVREDADGLESLHRCVVR